MIRAHHLHTATAIIREQGISELLRSTALWWSERRYEMWLGIDSGRQTKLDAMGVNNADAEMYCPANYNAFFKAAEYLDKRVLKGSFAEYGAGLGRIVCAAATMPFNRVIGVELSEALVERGRRNVEAARLRFQCKSAELLGMDAALWQVPDDVTVFHFYNPFKGPTLEAVISNIVDSLRRSPRRAAIMFSSPWHLTKLLASNPEAIPSCWITDSLRVNWPIVRQTTNPDDRSYRILALDSAAIESQ